MAQPGLAKSLPHSLDAEHAILGAILMDNAAIVPAAEKLTAADFFSYENRRIFDTMLKIREAEQPIDLITLVEHLTSIGQLEAAGGAAYVSTLMDGMPHITNVGHYAAIVKEKSQIRAIIHGTEIVQNKALDGLMSAHELAADLDVLVRLGSNGNGHGRPKPIDLEDFILTSLKPVNYVINPILPEQALALIYAWRGAGKTFFNLEIAVAVATGGPKCFCWDVPAPRRVLYVDGEMPANELQDRLQKILIGRGMKMPLKKGMFQIFTPDLVEGHVLNIVTRAGQKLIEDHLEPGTLLILDNLSALGHAPGSSESESESWWPVQEWALSLRKKGITIIFIHHAGKKGEQRGTSAREDLMHTVIGMKKPADYSQHEGLRTEITFEKIRRYEGAAGLYPFEIKMESDDRGGIRWLQRPLVEIIDARVKELLGMGMKVSEVAEECHLSRYQVYRIQNRLAPR
jgi:DnaB-like helicase N terminal domain/AAA domain